MRVELNLTFGNVYGTPAGTPPLRGEQYIELTRVDNSVVRMSLGAATTCKGHLLPLGEKSWTANCSAELVGALPHAGTLTADDLRAREWNLSLYISSDPTTEFSLKLVDFSSNARARGNVSDCDGRQA